MTSPRRYSLATERKVNQKIVLECLHVIELSTAATLGELLYCVKCADYKVVVSTPLHDYFVKCGNCRVARPFGAAQLNAEVFIAHHRQKHTSHVVGLYDGKLLIQTFGALQATMPTFWDRVDGSGEVPF